jgi:hypothetical protein
MPHIKAVFIKLSRKERNKEKIIWGRKETKNTRKVRKK